MKFCSILGLLICGLVCVTNANRYSKDDSGRIKRANRSRGSSSRSTVRVSTRWRKTAVSNRLFAHKLYRNVARNHPEGNLLISPFVVSTGLSMVLLGANGTTEQELMDTLEYSGMGTKKNGEEYLKADVPKLYQTLLARMKSNATGYTFSVASKLFGEQTENFLPKFVSDTEKFYGAKFEAVDFAGNPEGARDHINEWVSNKTLGLIEEAVPPGGVSGRTLLTLVSTAYFKGTWKNQFSPENTSPGVFHLRNGERVMADFMSGSFTLLHKFSSAFDGEIVILPYISRNPRFEIRMELFLTYDLRHLSLFETLDETWMNSELHKLKPRSMLLYLPKFRMDYDIDLRSNLETLGLRSLFGAADLSGMNGKQNLNIANAIHQSFIKVNEEGTTAGSAIALTTTRSTTRELRFDHPFFFMIREMNTNSVLFMGRVDRPN